MTQPRITGQSRAIGRMLSLLTALALTVAAFLDWAGHGVQPPRIPLRDLVRGISYTGTDGPVPAAGFWVSMSLPLLAAALLALLACLLAWRTLAWLSFVVALATTATWTALTAVHDRGFSANDWHAGYWAALVGLLLGLVAAVIPWRRPT